MAKAVSFSSLTAVWQTEGRILGGRSNSGDAASVGSTSYDDIAVVPPLYGVPHARALQGLRISSRVWSCQRNLRRFRYPEYPKSKRQL